MVAVPLAVGSLLVEADGEDSLLIEFHLAFLWLDAENDISFHHSTAGDLCVIMSYCAWKSPKSTQFLEITQTMKYTFETKEGQMVFSNHNRLLTETDYCISGKTGFTTKAGYCYVAAVEKDGRRMCLSLLGCGWPNNKNYKWADAKSLVEYAVSDAAGDSRPES